MTTPTTPKPQEVAPQLGEYQPITGYIILCISGEVQMVQAHFIGGLPLPDGVAVCKRAQRAPAAPLPVAMPDDVAKIIVASIQWHILFIDANPYYGAEDNTRYKDLQRLETALDWLQQRRPEQVNEEQ